MKVFEMIMMLMVLSFPLKADDQPEYKVDSQSIDEELASDRAFVRQMDAMEQFRLNQSNIVNRALFTQALRDAGVLLLDDCIYKGKRSCRTLIRLFTQRRINPSTKCYGIMLAGYMCKIQKDLEMCNLYKIHKNYCKNLELVSP